MKKFIASFAICFCMIAFETIVHAQTPSPTQQVNPVVTTYMMGSVQQLSWNFSVSGTPDAVATNLTQGFTQLNSLAPGDAVNITNAQNQANSKVASAKSGNAPTVTVHVSRSGPSSGDATINVSASTTW